MTWCICGHEAIFKQYVRYQYPRTEWLSEAEDPFRVHGGGYQITTCGNPQCESGALAACRERIIDDHVLAPWPWLPSGLSAEQMAALELEVTSW